MTTAHKRGVQMALPFLIEHLDVDDKLLTHFEKFRSFSPGIIDKIKVSFH